jgi:hypothetical protein
MMPPPMPTRGGVRLRRWLPARMVGTTGLCVVYLGGLISVPVAIAQGEFDLILSTYVLVGLFVGELALEASAWAAVDSDAVTWRSALLRRSIPLEAIVDVEEVPHPRFLGDWPVLRVNLDNGRSRLIPPTIAVGARAREEFAGAIRDRLRGPL